jgi:hypothetical protein
LAPSGIGRQALLPSLLPDPLPAAPAGLSSLPALLPELAALAEGLAPFAGPQAVSALQRGALAAFRAVCDAVHASLVRLRGVGGAAGANGAGAPGAAAAGGGGGPTASAAGPPLVELAGYAAVAVAELRLFATQRLQVGARASPRWAWHRLLS